MTTSRAGLTDEGMYLTSVTATSTGQAEADGLRLANIALAERNKELNSDIERVWDYYHNHYDECPASRDNIAATICRFILRHT